MHQPLGNFSAVPLKTPKKSWSFSGIQSFEQGHPNLGSLYSGCACYFLSGSTTVFDEPSGAACMPGGVSPCGLDAGAPPVLVFIGPVQPCGCNCPFVSGVTVRPMLDSGLTAVLFSGRVCAHAIPVEETKHTM